MHGLFVEKHSLEGKSLSWRLARHICAHGPQGKIAIVTDKPEALLSAVRKQWLKLIRQTQRERASTLNHRRKCELDHLAQQMQQISFTAQDPAEDPVAHIAFATVERFALFPPICATLYVTCPISRTDLYMITSWMPRNGVVVVYG